MLRCCTRFWKYLLHKLLSPPFVKYSNTEFCVSNKEKLCYSVVPDSEIIDYIYFLLEVEYFLASLWKVCQIWIHSVSKNYSYYDSEIIYYTSWIISMSKNKLCYDAEIIYYTHFLPSPSPPSYVIQQVSCLTVLLFSFLIQIPPRTFFVISQIYSLNVAMGQIR